MIWSSPDLQRIEHGPFSTSTERICILGSGYLTTIRITKLQFFKGLFDQSEQFPFITKKKSQIILQSLDSTTAVQRKFTITLFSMWAKCLHSPDLRSNTWSVSLTWKEKITHSFFSFELFSIIKEASISDFLLYWSSKQFGALVNSVMNSLRGNIPIHKVLPFPVYT